MKKLTTATMALMLLFAVTVIAQTNQGNVMIGTSTVFTIAGNNTDAIGFGFSSIKYKSDAPNYNELDADKRTSFNISPKAGYFVIENLAIGLNIDYFWTIYKNGQNDSKNTSVTFGAGPFVRYYMPLQKVMPYAELNAGFGIMKDTYESDNFDNVTKSNVTNLGAGLGIAAPLSDKFTFDVLLGYSSVTIKEKEDNPDNNRAVIGTLGIKLGLTFFIGSSVAN